MQRKFGVRLCDYANYGQCGLLPLLDAAAIVEGFNPVMRATLAPVIPVVDRGLNKGVAVWEAPGNRAVVSD